jgi:hypothetical protein
MGLSHTLHLPPVVELSFHFIIIQPSIFTPLKREVQDILLQRLWEICHQPGAYKARPLVGPFCHPSPQFHGAKSGGHVTFWEVGCIAQDTSVLVNPSLHFRWRILRNNLLHTPNVVRKYLSIFSDVVVRHEGPRFL